MSNDSAPAHPTERLPASGAEKDKASTGSAQAEKDGRRKLGVRFG